METPQGLRLASRYFPKSYEKHTIENPKPAKIFEEELAIYCEYCNKNLIEDKSGIMVLLRKMTNWELNTLEPYTMGYFSCKGVCDRVLKNKYLQDDTFIDEWVDIPDFMTPTGYIKKVMGWLNSLQNGEKIEKDAFEKVKTYL